MTLCLCCFLLGYRCLSITANKQFNLRLAASQTQEGMAQAQAQALGVGYDTASRLEQRSDMRLSAMRLRR